MPWHNLSRHTFFNPSRALDEIESLVSVQSENLVHRARLLGGMRMVSLADRGGTRAL